MRKFNVGGFAKVSVEPDTVVISFNLLEMRKEYKDCIEALNRRTASLRSDFEAVGCRSNALKTIDIKIGQKTHYDEKKKSHTLSGYLGSHKLYLEFPLDKDLLNEVLKRIPQGPSQANLQILFTVGDKEPLKQAALAEAVKSAKRNAQFIAEAAGITLGKIMKIDYGWTEVTVYDWRFSDIDYREGLQDDSKYFNIEPKGVSVSDRVNLVYEIID
jgi:uncharacterized protein